MNQYEQLQKLALSFPEVTEEPHFEKSSFRVKKKIFVTYDYGRNSATVKLEMEAQGLFSADNAVHPVPNKWGQQGWTVVDLDKIHPDLFKDILIEAYCTVAPKKLAAIVKPQ